MSYESWGVIERTVGDSLAYLVSRENGRSFAFAPDCIDGYRGQLFQDIGLVDGAEVSFEVDSAGHTVTHVKLEERSQQRSAFGGEILAAPTVTPAPRKASTAPRYELHPDNPARGTTQALRALPPATRAFMKLIDTDVLRAGDLLLTREAKPGDTVCRLITDVQAEGGYAKHDAQWVHAAMYLGDGAHVVEATVDGLLTGGSVRITSLDAYCDGGNILRFRRPIAIGDERTAWRMCIRALSRLGQSYNVMAAAKMWFDVVVRGGGFFDEKKHATSVAVVCSTLYADSYNETTRQTLGEVNGACVPAWLSLSDAFQDVDVGWLDIV